jgi:hypothetical protein
MHGIIFAAVMGGGVISPESVLAVLRKGGPRNPEAHHAAMAAKYEAAEPATRPPTASA